MTSPLRILERDLLCASDECLGTRPSGKLASCNFGDVSLLFAAHDIILSMRWWGLNTGGVVIGFLWRDLTRMRKPSEPLAMRKSRAHWEESPGKWEQSMSSGITKQSIHNFKKNFETIASIMSPLQTQQSTGSDEIRYAKARDTSEKKMHLSRNGLQGWRHTSFSSFSLFATSSLSLSSSTACWTSWPNP